LSGGTTSYGPRCQTEASLSCDLNSLTFDLLTSKWRRVSSMSRAFFVQIFSFLRLPGADPEI